MRTTQLDGLRRLLADPYAWVLSGAAVVQIVLTTSAPSSSRPWVIAGWGAWLAVGVLVLGLRRQDERSARRAALRARLAPWAMVVGVAFWRVAESSGVNGVGLLALVPVLWFAIFGQRRAAIGMVVVASAAMLFAPWLLRGAPITLDDLRRTVLIALLGLPIGIAVATLVRNTAVAHELVRRLQPAGSQLGAVLDAAIETLIICRDTTGIITTFSPGAERMLGWSADEVVGKHSPLLYLDAEEVLARASALGVDPGLDVVLRAEAWGSAPSDWAMRTRDGRRLIVSLSVSPVRDPEGRVIGAVGIGTDVTESRAAERQLAAQRRIHEVLIEHLPLVGVGLADENLEWVTLGGHSASGVDLSSLVGTPVGATFGEAAEALRTFYRRALEGPVHEVFRLPTGTIHAIEAQPVRGPDGERLVMGVARDVTAEVSAADEREAMLAALAVSEARFREAFVAAPVGIAVVGVDGPLHFVQVNPSFAATLGRTVDELAGLEVASVVHPSDQGDGGSGALIDLTASQPRRTRIRFLRPSGRAIWTEATSAVVRDQDGRPAHVVVYVQDINALKQSERALLDALEQQRAATQSLRELAQLRSEVVGTVSHELRTPLTSIHGYLELLAEEPLAPHQADMITVALRNSERIAALVDNLLVLVRLDDATRLSRLEEIVGVGQVVTSAVATVRPVVEERHQHLVVRIVPDANLPMLVRGDADQLERVVLNLLSNAAKYTGDNGTIEIAAQILDGCVHLTVSDDGIGIPHDEQQLLFSRFFRASTARDSAVAGHGLGLAIVKSIVERHDGRVGVESVPGVGSCFEVVLPLARAEDRVRVEERGPVVEDTTVAPLAG